MTYDLLIKGGRIYDGSGMPSFTGDIGVKNGRIAEVGRHDELVSRPDGTYAMLYQMQLLESRKIERRVVPS